MKRWILILVAVLIGSTLLASGVVLYCAPEGPPAGSPALVPPPPDTSHLVRARMRNVAYRIDRDLIMSIEYLVGWLEPTQRDSVPVFDQPGSFRITVASAVVALDTLSLSHLLNRYVFGYRGSPIHGLAVSVEDGLLKQHGKLGTLSFTIKSSITVTPEGLIRLHPEDVKVLGINADGFMDKLGIELDEMVKLKQGIGARVVANDFLIDPSVIVPPPRLEATLRRVRLTPGAMVLEFGPRDSLGPQPYFSAEAPAKNFMSFTGARLRFGKLTMNGTDMVIVDADESDPLDFSLKHYHAQLVAGRHRTTPEDGLVVWLPDFMP